MNSRFLTSGSVYSNYLRKSFLRDLLWNVLAKAVLLENVATYGVSENVVAKVVCC